MKKSRRLVNKKAKKKFLGKCHFCEESDYSLLDLHRVLDGALGGIYSDFNTVVCCANCHRKIHSKKIILDRKYFSTSAKWLLHYWIDGEEYWK